MLIFRSRGKNKISFSESVLGASNDLIIIVVGGHVRMAQKSFPVLVQELEDLLEPVTPNNVKQLLVATWLWLHEAPHLVMTGYHELSEDALVAQARDLALGLEANVSPAIDPSTQQSAGRSAGILLRALEIVANNLAPTRAVRRPEDLIVQAFGNEVFLIPSPSRLRSVSTSADPKRAFARRALLTMRVVPRVLTHSHQVNMVVARDYADDMRSPRVSGCLFPCLTIDTDAKVSGFRAAAIQPCLADAAVLAVQEARNNNSDVLIFPELTGPPVVQASVTSELRNPTDQTGSTFVPSLVVAGSWHDEDEQNFYNCARVYDGVGTFLGKHKKNFVYRNDGIEEAISADDRILVILCGDVLFGVAICLDHCNIDGRMSPYNELDVDFLLVPSCGEDGTLKAHQGQAHRVFVERKVVSVVVQQEYPGREAGFGYLLVGETDPIHANKLVTTLNL